MRGGVATRKAQSFTVRFLTTTFYKNIKNHLRDPRADCVLTNGGFVHVHKPLPLLAIGASRRYP